MVGHRVVPLMVLLGQATHGCFVLQQRGATRVAWCTQ
jgi:hypothetical protein